MITVLFMLPQVSPVTWETFNYAPIAVLVVLGFAAAWWLASARHWFLKLNPSEEQHSGASRLGGSASAADALIPPLRRPAGAAGVRRRCPGDDPGPPRSRKQSPATTGCGQLSGHLQPFHPDDPEFRIDHAKSECE